MKLSTFLNGIDKNNRTKLGGYPSKFTYTFDKGHATVRAKKKMSNKADFRRMDPWALAFVSEVQDVCDVRVDKLTLEIPKSVEKKYWPNFESFRRRVSFLALNNSSSLDIQLKMSGMDVKLETGRSLFHRPKEEIVRTKSAEPSGSNKGDMLEKDFQSFLYGDRMESKTRTNDRLAILGDDFRSVKGKKLPVAREFPTGVFRGTKSEKNRIMPSEFVDIVSMNKWKQLSVIELKLDDSSLEVNSQILDYALFFSAYIDQLTPQLNEAFFGRKKSPAPVKFKTKPIQCYVASNVYHPRSAGIAKFYSTPEKKYPFVLSKLTLGQIERF